MDCSWWCCCCKAAVWGGGRCGVGPLVMWVQPEGEVVRVRLDLARGGLEGLFGGLGMVR